MCVCAYAYAREHCVYACHDQQFCVSFLLFRCSMNDIHKDNEEMHTCSGVKSVNSSHRAGTGCHHCWAWCRGETQTWWASRPFERGLAWMVFSCASPVSCGLGLRGEGLFGGGLRRKDQKPAERKCGLRVFQRQKKNWAKTGTQRWVKTSNTNSHTSVTWLKQTAHKHAHNCSHLPKEVCLLPEHRHRRHTAEGDGAALCAHVHVLLRGHAAV